MNKNLDRIEAHLKNFFEEKLVQIITGRQPIESLIDRLLKALRDNLKTGQEGLRIAPDQFLIKVNQEDLMVWQSHQDVLDQIASLLQEQGTQEGLHFPGKPSIAILSDDQIPEHHYEITAHFSPIKATLPDTTAMPQSQPSEQGNLIPKEAYLIVRGTKTFPLVRMVVNIGRHSENDLTLHDPHISRHHAQLRVINRHFVLFDVGSTGGVLLNGKKISQATLQSGDVIRLGTSNLIYVQETLSEEPTTAFPIDNESAP